MEHFLKLPIEPEKVRELCPTHLQSNRSLILCDLQPASDLGKRAALSSAHLPTLTSPWCKCMETVPSIKTTPGVSLHKAGALMPREFLPTIHGQLVPPHAAGHNPHSVNLIHQLQVPQQTHHLSILTNRKKTRNKFLPVMILFFVFHMKLQIFIF